MSRMRSFSAVRDTERAAKLKAAEADGKSHQSRVLDPLSKSFRLADVKARLDAAFEDERVRMEIRQRNRPPPVDLGDE